jgi:hypothetical protein
MLREKPLSNIFAPYITVTYLSTSGRLSYRHTPCFKEGAKDSKEMEVDFAEARVYG